VAAAGLPIADLADLVIAVLPAQGFDRLVALPQQGQHRLDRLTRGD
jgi:hypothetical protein